MLVRVEDVEKTAFELGRRIRDRILLIPDRVAAILAAESDQLQVSKVLKRELRDAISEING